jgi:ABC-type transport system substrate-binding protein
MDPSISICRSGMRSQSGWCSSRRGDRDGGSAGGFASGGGAPKEARRCGCSRGRADGQADWVELFSSAPFHQLANLRGLDVGRPANPAYLNLTYNVRPGELFSDVRLRRAVELCLDKPAATAAATDGRDIAAYADVPPGSWAHDADIPTPARDVAAARALIESAGWTPDADGVYVKDGKPLAATIYVNQDPERVKLAGIIELQERECGMKLQASRGDFFGGLASIVEWPNHGPDGDTPFDLYLLSWGTNWDPLTGRFRSTEVSTKARPDGINFGGFTDPRIDDLLHRIETTYDLAARADLSRQY